jgi:hypothetical protein
MIEQNAFEFELSEEQKKLAELMEKMREAAQVLCDALVELAKKVIEIFRALAERLARFFVKIMLLEWHMPLRWADLIAGKMPWYWAVRLGFWWFGRKLALVE